MNIPEWAKYVARDKDGALYTYVIKPTKGSRVWLYGGKYIWLPSELFPDVKWSDEEPTEIVQILMHERGGGMIEYYKENLEEHNANEEHLEYHTKESVVNLYKDLLKLANKLMEEVAE